MRLAARIESMDLVRDAMRSWLGGAPLERSAAEDVVLATWEACANAIEHAVDAADDIVTLRAELGTGPDSRRGERQRALVTAGRARESWARAPSDRSLMSSLDIAESETGTTITIEKELAEPTGAPAD